MSLLPNTAQILLISFSVLIILASDIYPYKFTPLLKSQYISILCLLIFGASFYFLRSNNLLFGDIAMWMAEIDKSLLRFSPDFGSVLFHRFIYNTIFNNELRGLFIYRWTSIIGGWIYLIVIYLFVRKKEIRIQNLWHFSFLSSGSILLFFGYGENYMFLYLFTFIYFILHKNENYVLSGLFLLSSITSHLLAIILIPGYIYTVSNSKINNKKEVLSIFVIFSILLFLLSYKYLFINLGLTKWLLPILSTIERPYAIFSYGKIRDIINTLFLLIPISIIIISSNTNYFKISNKWFHYLNIISVTTVLIFMDVAYEGSDWDFYSFISIPITIYSLSLLEKKDKTINLYKALAFSIMLFHTLPWIIVNNNENLALRQFTEIVKVFKHKDPVWLYGRNMYLLNNKNLEKYDLTIKIGNEALSAGFSDFRIWENMAYAYYNLRQNNEAKKLYMNIVEYDTCYYQAWGMLGTIYMENNNYDSASYCFQKTINIHKDDVNSWHLLVTALIRKGDISNALVMCNMALGQWPQNGKLWSLLTVCLLQTKGAGLKYAANNAIKYLPEEPATHINAGIAYAILNEPKKALDIWKNGYCLFPGNQKLQILQNMNENQISIEFLR